MTKQESAMRLALEALEWNLPVIKDWGGEGALNLQHKAITALRAALEQDGQCKHCTDGCAACDARKLPEQEPVAWATREDFYRELDRAVKDVREDMQIKSVTMRCKDYDLALPIIDQHFGRVLVGQVSYTHPAREPLTDEEIKTIWGSYFSRGLEFARAIEAAHGIGEKHDKR